MWWALADADSRSGSGTRCRSRRAKVRCGFDWTGALLVASASCICLPACVGDEPARAVWTGTADTLASGLVVVHNPDNAMYDGRATWSIREQRTIGSGGGGAPLGEVWDLAVDDEGSIYALLTREEKILVFDRDGSALRQIRTSTAETPITVPVKLALDSLQRLWVLDSRNARYAAYDSTGMVVDTMPRPIGPRAGHCRPVTCGWFDRRGDLVDGTMVIGRDTVYRNMVATSRAAWPSGTPFQFVLEPWIGVLAFVPFRDRTAYAFDPSDFFWLGSPQEYVLRKVSLSPPYDTVLTTSRTYTPRPLNDTERGKLQSLRSRLARALGESTAVARLPTVAPAFTLLTVDDEGRVWVARYDASDGATRDFDVFDPQGRFLARARADFDVKVNPASRAPESPSPIVIRGDEFYSLRSDGPGLDYVVHAKIRGAR